MMTVRKSQERGHAQHGWLDSWHTFSFADYYDPAHLGVGSLRVINDDRVAPGQGFPTHAHRDMEIISYVLDGALEHEDSLGNGSVIRAGDVQRMSAGRGVRHSECNASTSVPVHFLQIWITPASTGIAPGYEQKRFAASDKHGRLRLVASPDGADGSLTLHQDARVYATLLGATERVTHVLAPGRRGYVHVARGALTVNGIALGAGDGVRIEDEAGVRMEHGNDAEALLFDLA